MILTIAILALIGFVSGVMSDFIKDEDIHPRPIIIAIGVIAWWSISFPFAIIFLAVGGAWFLLSIITYNL